MLKPLQVKKLTKLFGAFDADGDGQLQKSDYESVADNLAELRDAKPDSPEYAELMGIQMGVWEGLRAQAERAGSDGVGLDEYLAWHDQLLGSEAQYEAIIAMAAELFFKMLDANGDGKVTCEEYKAFLRAYRVDPSDWADEVFARADTNSDGCLSREEVLSATRVYYASDDPQAIGNELFGPY